MTVVVGRAWDVMRKQGCFGEGQPRRASHSEGFCREAMALRPLCESPIMYPKTGRCCAQLLLSTAKHVGPFEVPVVRSRLRVWNLLSNSLWPILMTAMRSGDPSTCRVSH